MDQLQPYMNYIMAVLGLLVALGVLVLFFRLIRGGARGRKGLRLGIVEYCEIDQTRRLVLLRRDGVEHLVLIGGPQDLLVEANIGTDAPAATLAPPSAEDAIPLRAPRAPVFGAKRPVLRSVNPDDDGPALA